MEKAARLISERIALQLQYDPEKQAVVEYGLLAIFNILVIGLIVSFAGVLFHFLYECAIIFLGVGILKKSTGGAHAGTLLGCTLISVFSILFFAALSRYLLDFTVNIYLSTGITAVISALCFVVFYKKVPVDSLNKPIRKPEKIKRLRRQSFMLLGLYTALSLTAAFLAPVNARFYGFAFCLHFVLLWQAFMLTRSGQAFIGRLEPKTKVKEVRE